MGVGAEVAKVSATFASTVASIAVSASRVPRIPAATVAGTSAVGRDAVCVSAGDGTSLVQATAVRLEITKTIRMIILIFFTLVQSVERGRTPYSLVVISTRPDLRPTPASLMALTRYT